MEIGHVTDIRRRRGTSLAHWLIWALALVLFAGCARKAPEHHLVHARGGAIRIPIGEVNDGKVHFFTWQHERRNINFFVRTDAKGRLRTYYDACYSCYKYKLGFRVVGKKLLCVACGLTYDLDQEEWDFIGPCAPIPLTSKVTADAVIIDLKRIQRGKKLF